MVVTIFASSGMALFFADSGTTPSFLAIGNGSGTSIGTAGSLVSESGTRQTYTTREIGTQKKCTWTWDYNTVQMSGIGLKEFGQFSRSGTSIDTPWIREAFSNIAFNGTNELQVQVTLEIF